MHTPCVRAAREADLEAMTQLIGQLFALEPDYTFDADKARRALSLLLNKQDAALWVAERAGRVIGMCSAQIVISSAEGGPVAWVEDVVVSPGERGGGIGRLLLAAVDRWAKTSGVSRLQLLADQENQGALGFYRKLGWQATRMRCLRRHPER